MPVIMKTREDVEALLRLIGQLDGLHAEVTQLTKKSPDGAVNKFKLNLINKVLTSGNDILGDEYRPFADFMTFDVDDVPTNSDITLVVTQYRTQAEKLRSDCVVYSSHQWVYAVDGNASDVKAAPPTRVGGKNG